MPVTTLRAHFDGKHIVLDEPFTLLPNAPMIVTVIAPESERTDWSSIGFQGLVRAYGEDEPEYTAADLRPK